MRPRAIVQAVALVLAGAVIGIGIHRVWSDARQRQQLAQARQQVTGLFQGITPKVELQLDLIEQALEELESELMQANTATSSAAIQPTHYRARQKRLQTQAEQVAQTLKRFDADIRQSLHALGVSEHVEVFSPAQQEKLTALDERLDRAVTSLHTLGGQIELAKERRLLLSTAETEAARKVEAEAEAARRAQVETAQRAAAEATQRAQLEAIQRAQTEALRSLQNEAIQRTQIEAIKAAAEHPAPPALWAGAVPSVVVVQPTVRYVEEPLVIGSSYPDRPWGSRLCYHRLHYHRFGCFAPYGPSPWFHRASWWW